MNPFDGPGMAVRLVFADGTQEERSWTVAEMMAMGQDVKERMQALPGWLLEPRKTWNHPQDPILYSALVKPGHDEEARGWLADLDAENRHPATKGNDA